MVIAGLYANPLERRERSVGASVGLLSFWHEQHCGRMILKYSMLVKLTLVSHPYSFRYTININRVIWFPATCEGVADISGYNMPIAPGLQTPLFDAYVHLHGSKMCSVLLHTRDKSIFYQTACILRVPLSFWGSPQQTSCMIWKKKGKGELFWFISL